MNKILTLFFQCCRLIHMALGVVFNAFIIVGAAVIAMGGIMGLAILSVRILDAFAALLTR